MSKDNKLKEERTDRGYGFWSRDGSFFHLMKCFECGLNNWAPIVASGQCAHCGYDHHTKQRRYKTKGQKK